MKTYILFLFFGTSLFVFGQTTSKYIVVDQFGYRPNSEKIAVIRNPITGFDAAESFAPSNNYALINVSTGLQVFTASVVPWNFGNEDASSGDQAWWFDFSSYQIPGTYYVLDSNQNVKSFDFVISENVYEEVLKHAVRTLFFQRAGYAKEAQYAGTNWADGASHLGPLQDTQCRKYDAPNNAFTEKDLRGGWYDAGDFNKYTTWTANYIVDLLKAYKENPNAWGDNYNLPYSGNGTPDIMDEIKWGLDYLLRLQEANGAMISIVSVSHASPPSSATGPSLYGAVNTSCTLASAIAFSYGSKIFNELGYTTYASTLQQGAISAWNWAEANPNVIWENNSAAYNSQGIGAGQQETDAYGRFTYKIRAAIHLYDLTGMAQYKTFVEANYQNVQMMLWNFAFPFQQENQDALLYYATRSGVTASVASSIKSTYQNAMNASDNFGGLYNESDPYLAHLKDYVWGSNGTKSRKGLMFTNYVTYAINAAKNADALRAAERYIHYIHGLNPLNFCYLSNMYDYGADHGVNEFYHSWFANDTPWDNVKNDLYGPAPGFLVGGPNPSYNWDGCCPSGCGGQACDAIQVARISGQPKQKAYDDFNTSWPMNSWEVTENSNGYQTAYIRLLSKFVGLNGSLAVTTVENDSYFKLYPNPFEASFQINAKENFNYRIYDLSGRMMDKGTCENECSLGEAITNTGVYFINITTSKSSKTFKIIKK